MPKTDAQQRATIKFDKKTYDKIALILRKDEKINGNFIRRYAENEGMSVSGLIKRAILEAIENDKQK